jgi:hypothetical protein
VGRSARLHYRRRTQYSPASRWDAYWVLRLDGSGALHDRFGGNRATHRRHEYDANCLEYRSGIGFLGAGVILRERGSVVGLTTAATIFVVAAMGMAAGGGLYAVSGVACTLVLCALVLLFYVEDWLNLKPRYMLFRIFVDRAENMVTDVHRIFSELKVGIDNFQVSLAGEKNLIQFDAEVTTHQQEKILAALCKPGVSCEMLPVERQNG